MSTSLLKAQTNFENTIKTLLFQQNPALIEKLNFDDEEVFLVPLLFAYFISTKKKLFPPQILEEILQGYFVEKEPLALENSFNRNDVAYIPKIGYFKKDQENPFEPILKQGDFEVVKAAHPVLERYFTESYRGEILNANPDYQPVWRENYQELFKAIEIIQEYLPEFYKKLTFANRKIYLHNNPKIINFASVETLGMLYFYVIGKSNLIYFIEELIHQGAHNYLYYVLQDRSCYFKIDVENAIMRNYTHKPWDYRSIYGAFHGLYTVTMRVECFNELLKQNVFQGREKHELLGRLTDQISRFRTGLELLNQDEVFTEKGKRLYHRLDSSCEAILNKFNILKITFDLSNRDLDFRYGDFCQLNPIEDFYKKEAEGVFSF